MCCDETSVTMFCEYCCDVFTISVVNIIDKHHVMIMMSMFWEMNKSTYKILQNFTKIYAIIFLSSLLNSVVDAKTKNFFSTWCKTHWYYPYFQGNWRLQFSGCVRNWWFVVAFLYRNHTCVQSVNRDMPSVLQTQWEYGPQLSPWWWWKHPVEQCSTSIWKINPKP